MASFLVVMEILVFHLGIILQILSAHFQCTELLASIKSPFFLDANPDIPRFLATFVKVKTSEFTEIFFIALSCSRRNFSSEKKSLDFFSRLDAIFLQKEKNAKYCSRAHFFSPRYSNKCSSFGDFFQA